MNKKLTPLQEAIEIVCKLGERYAAKDINNEGAWACADIKGHLLKLLPKEREVIEEDWISVEDRLPENNDMCNDVVLFYSVTHGFVMVGCYDIEDNTWTRLPWEKGYKSLQFNEVTHWKPLPKLPNI